MTNKSDRLDRIEAILETNSRLLQVMIEQRATDKERQEETESIVQSNSRLLQAILEQRATDRLKREEEKIEHEERMTRLEDSIARLARIEEAQNRMLASMDEDRPTVLRRLMSIENKLDSLIEHNQ